MHKRTIITYLILSLLPVSCNTSKQEIDNEMPLLYPHPLTVKFNPIGGYTINPITGDSIQPLINSIGDTIKTGIAFTTEGFQLNPGIPYKPRVFAALEPDVIPVEQNVFKIPEKPTIIPVNIKSLKSYIPGKEIYNSTTLVNSTGDTIPSGVPIPVMGKVVPCRMPVPVKALTPRLRGGARINMRYLDVEQGMNSSFISAIIEDSQGNLWFGTSGGGVSKYNGESFIHFTEREGLSNNYITSILEDKNGNLWFGTQYGGVTMYNGESFTHFTETEGLSNNYVRTILEDQHGNIWFGTWGGGATRYDGKTFTHFTLKEGLCHFNIFIMTQDIQRNIWFGTQGGVCMYNDTAFIHLSVDEGLIFPFVWSALGDSKGRIWFGTNRGLSMFDGKSFTNFTEKEGLIDNFISAMEEDSYGNIWFGTVAGGVSKYDGESFTNYGDKEGLSPGDMNCIQEDSYGNIWFGTVVMGVNIYNPQVIEYYTEKEGLSNHIISPIMEDNKGNLWLATTGNGVNMYDGKVFRHIIDVDGLTNNFIESLLEDSHGNIWFGSDMGGLIKYNGKTFSQFTDNWNLGIIYSMLEDSSGSIWLGTWTQGVIRFNGETFTYYTDREGFSNNDVRSILKDRYGNIWFGTRGGGIVRYDGKNFIIYTQKEGLSDNFVWCMLEDSRGNLWFGTENGGANMFDGDSITYFTIKEGLSNNFIKSIVEDNNGNIWIGTMNGLNCLTFSSESVSGKGNRKWPVIRIFNEQDGLKGIDFENSSVELDSRNRIWWGTDKCLTMIDMNDFKLPTEAPSHMQFDRIEINGKFIDYRHWEENINNKIQFDSVARFYNYPLNLKLPYKYNHLTFYYSAIDWSAPHKIKYSYRIDGLRDNWSVPSAETKAEYRNLPSGTFTFEVRAIGASQKWSEPFEYNFTILSPWWYSWWAYLIYGLILISAIVQYRRFLLKRAKLRSDVQIERIEKEKVLELDQLKSRFFANISHEFRTPLTLLLGPINDFIKNRPGMSEGDRKLLKIMKRNAGRLQQLIDQLLDLSRLETGNLKLEVSEGDLTGFIRIIILSFLSLAESKHIRYEYNLAVTDQELYFDRDKVEKITTNLISNALKFTPEGGSVLVALRYSVEKNIVLVKEVTSVSFAEIEVKDTGPGIPENEKEKIFSRFYQVSSSDSRKYEGSGIGLSLAKELVDLYRGEIHVESIMGKGSTFTVRLPVSREQFREGEIVVVSEKPVDTISSDALEMPSEKATELDAQEKILGVKEKEKDNGLPIVLIVEDNTDLRNYISGNLSHQYQILESGNGKEGLDKAIESIPDLVISDLMMPEMDGIEMCNWLKKDARTNHIPVIMLTAKADRESKLEGLETGVDDYIIKPFDADELKVRVKNLIEQRKNLRERYRKEFLADPASHEIHPAEDEFVARLMDCMKKHLEDPEFNVKQLGEELHLSHTQLYRKVRSLTDHTPNEYIRNTRLKMAARMFQEGHRNISTVLYTTGFNSPSYFTESFRELFGMSPSEYIKQRRNTKL
jgi:two-component system, sensor histidine kinase ChiS